MKILIVEDDLKTSSFIARGLKQEGFSVDVTHNGTDGLHYLSEGQFDAAVIDVMMPKMDGLTLIDITRRQKITTPILVLSAGGSVDDRVRGLHAGGDDYLVKPFAFSELVARLYALIRRSHSVTEPTTLSVGDCTIDLVRRRVTRSGRDIELQPKEFALLEYLMRNAGKIVSKTMIMEHVWDFNFDPETNVVEARICKLRNKIDHPFKTNLIHTIRGAGYVLETKE